MSQPSMIHHELQGNDVGAVARADPPSAADRDLRALQLRLVKRYPSHGNTVLAVFKVFEHFDMNHRQMERFCGRHMVSLGFLHKFENIARRGDVSVQDFIRKLQEEDDRLPDSMSEIVSMMFARSVSWLKRACRL